MSVSEFDCKGNATNVLPELIENYCKQKTFNFDELGFFIKFLPDKSLMFKRSCCHGGKKLRKKYSFSGC